MKNKILFVIFAMLTLLFVFALSISAADVCAHENKRVTAIEYADFAQKGTMRFTCPSCAVTEKTVEPLFKLNGYSVPTKDSELCVGYTVNSEIAKELKKLNKDFDFGLVVAAKSGLGGEMPLNNATAEPFSEKCIKLSLLGITTDAVDFRLTDFDISTILEPLYFTAYSYDGNQVKYISTKTQDTPIEVAQALIQRSEDFVINRHSFSVFKPESTIAGDRQKQMNASKADYNTTPTNTPEELQATINGTKTITNWFTALAYPNGSSYMKHFLGASGKDYIISNMTSSGSGFFNNSYTKEHRTIRITEAMRAAEALAVEGGKINVYQEVEQVNAFPNDTVAKLNDWRVSVGSYFTCINMYDVTVTTGANGVKTYSAKVEYNVADFYNWDSGPNHDYEQFGGLLPSANDLHQLHVAGLAQEFVSRGTVTYNITWTEGQNADQISGIK